MKTLKPINCDVKCHESVFLQLAFSSFYFENSDYHWVIAMIEFRALAERAEERFGQKGNSTRSEEGKKEKWTFSGRGTVWDSRGNQCR